ncbi:hypothetical protein KY311_02190 [Candidatus Woesearchaeota archaeon]|nr:hypothetical protein [Candidatus Woesearchaeota archaeon]
MNKLLHTARLLAVVIVSFFVFHTFIMHGFTFTALIESSIWLILLGATMIAWGNRKIGGAVFVVFGIVYWYFAMNSVNILSNQVFFVSGPLVITGLLFIWEKKTMPVIAAPSKPKRKTKKRR